MPCSNRCDTDRRNPPEAGPLCLEDGQNLNRTAALSLPFGEPATAVRKPTFQAG